MAMTTDGLIYPEAGDHTRLWEHLQDLADSAQAAMRAREKVLFTYRGGAAVSIPHAAWTAVPLDVDDLDEAGVHSVVAVDAHKLTAPWAGLLSVSFHVTFDFHATGWRGARIVKGTNPAAPAGGSGDILVDIGQTATTFNRLQAVLIGYPIAAGEVISWGAWQNSGAALNVTSGQGATFARAVLTRR